MVKTLSFLLALTFTLACAPLANAQPANTAMESKTEQARRLFEEGVALANSKDWTEALWAFRRSRNLVPRPSTSYNIANALYRIDRPVEGLAELDKYDEMPAVLADRAAQERGKMLRGLLQDAAARVQLAITPPDAEVHVDGRRSKSTGRDRVIRLNPGPHSVRVTRDGYVPTRLEVQVERGGRETRAIALTPRAAPPAAPAPPKASLPVAVQLPQSAVSKSDVAVDSIELGAAQPPPIDDDRKRFVKRPGFWAMIGAIAAVGIGAGVAIALTRKDDGPSCGTTGTCATTQGLTVTSF